MKPPRPPAPCPSASCDAVDGSSHRETLSRDGALALARRLQRYWHDLGYPAACFWVEPIAERFAKVGTYEIYRVACNLVNGLPPRFVPR